VRIVFAGGGTGGHLYPGLAIARELVRLDPKVEPFFVGALRGVEREVLPTTGFPHLLLDLHPIYRPAVWKNWRTLIGAITSWRKIGRMVGEERPRLVVGTGGYAAGLMLAYAVVHRIPIVQQAGDSHPGITARGFAPWSREIYLAFPEAADVFDFDMKDRHRLIDAGAPITPPPDPLPDRGAARAKWGFPATGGRVLLVYGGSQGSLGINQAVAGWVKNGIPEDLHIIWATGRSTFDQFKHLDGPRVRVKDYLSPIADAYAATDLALARAGAMTTAELFAWKIPAVLVPLPTAAADHQTRNARALEAGGAAIHLPQSALTPEELAKTVTGVLASPSRMADLAAKSAVRARPHAARDIAQRILALLSSRAPRSSSRA
jgi:UDP-N-acetylglucosamine--N-acetylmuramyl-(pentapeptide) pyrophosphoryl-undecaprenol N-acetylglucosamine transferase